MKPKHLRLTGLAVAAFVSGLILSTAHSQASNELGAFVGRWQIDPDRTRMGRNGPNGKDILRSTTFSFVFSPEASGLRMEVFAEYPQVEPTRTIALVADGKPRVCASKSSCLTAGGSPSEQTYAWFKLDSHMMARLFWVKGNIFDYSTVCVSPDGKTLTLISWAPETPYYQNIQVFKRQ
jgi:hypothetical protein